MAKKEKKEPTKTEKDLKQLKKEIVQRGEEIGQLKKTIEEMRTQIQRKEKTGETAELSKIFEDVSKLLDAGFSIFGVSEKIQGGESGGKGLFGLISNLGKLAEKSETYQKRIKLGEKEVIDFRVRSGPIRRSYAIKSRGSLKIGKPQKETSFERMPKVSTAGSIEQREPIIDIFEEEDQIRVMTELPGLEEKEIKLDIEDTTLTISTDRGNYYKKVELPNSVKKDAMESSYRNGILEVKLRKAKNTGKTKENA